MKSDERQYKITNVKEIMEFPLFRESRITNLKKQIKIGIKELKFLLTQYKEFATDSKKTKNADKLYSDITKLSNVLISMHFEIGRSLEAEETNNDLVG